MRAIFIGFACNNGCLFCAQGELRKARPSAVTTVAAALSLIQAGEVVAFAGGEPTLLPELFAWIREATARGAASVILQTNARRLAYRAYARELREASTRLRLDVSLQGSTPALHDWHTGAPGSFAQTVQGLRHARAEGIPAGTTTVVTRSNYRHLGEIVRVAHASGATAVHFVPIEPYGGAARRRSLLVPPVEMIAPHLQRAASEALRLGLVVEVGAVTSRELFAGIGEVEAPPPAAERVEVDDLP
jgi:MoaA/NifB/PqqE/SkfB family radical SAM enzyme